jgi:hypothetical protein
MAIAPLGLIGIKLLALLGGDVLNLIDGTELIESRLGQDQFNAKIYIAHREIELNKSIGPSLAQTNKTRRQ